MRGLDLTRLREYLESVGFTQGPLTGELIAGGRSNLTYVIRGPASSEWVLRRPPLGHVLATAHDMRREYRVINALVATGVPVPRAYLLCTDTDVLGAPFYLMEKVNGTVYRTAEQTAHLGADRARTMSWELVDVLAELHSIDPESVGLADFGRPAGYVQRQLARWRKQLDASRSRDIDGIDELQARLEHAVPATQRPVIVHGDYRLDNVLMDERDRVAAVLDWEMSTLGDPLADLGLLQVYWERFSEIPGNPLTSAVNPAAGFPSMAEVAERYAARSGLDLMPLPWYVAFGYFKLAVISEGIHFRFIQGKTVGAGFDRMGDVVASLVALGLNTLDRSSDRSSGER